ncbi:hypothetical protein JZO83_08375 [Enterococcus sp. DIV1298c]|uniref:hypothetical protein n=1 Tax=Enterococcus sp. DIV1298c TaxID=2815328 RepID=UPI001A93A3E8|nr:hypothetical protein [Enterococcus sp. DIV1298c]MBO0461765.1 hypothetical protein [Enterococcus sp. DIV1298c]
MEKEWMAKKNQKKWIVLGLLLLIIGGVFLYFTNQENEPVPVVSAELLPGLRDASDIEIAERAQEIADANYFTLQIAPTAIFEDGESEGSIEIVNPGSNVYPIAVDLFLADSEEVIYSSGSIHPNQQIVGAKLDKSLDKGEYQAVARINIYDPETNERQGITEAEISITINN